MKKFYIYGFIFLFFMVNMNTAKAYTKDKDKKFRVEFMINKILTTNFEPESVNLSFDYTEPYQNNTATYLLSHLRIFGTTGFEEGRICIETDIPKARAKILAENFKFESGKIIHNQLQRKFSVKESGFPFRIGFFIPIVKRGMIGIDFYQTKKTEVELEGSQDYFTIQNLIKSPVPGTNYSWWEMDLERSFAEHTKKFQYHHMGCHLLFQYDLITLFNKLRVNSEAGINLIFSTRSFEDEIRYHDYQRTLFPEVIYPDEPISNFRVLNNTKKTSQRETKLRTRFFVGMNLEHMSSSFLSLSGTIRIYSHSIKEEWLEPAILDEVPINLKAGVVQASLGINLKF